ncbi:MAG: hypothetical protein LBL75_02700 [Rickettsiales bacterium]|jgi:hypothetical protein|nr:hypothetical protein [Rickettsiales bacterium]
MDNKELENFYTSGYLLAPLFREFAKYILEDSENLPVNVAMRSGMPILRAAQKLGAYENKIKPCWVLNSNIMVPYRCDGEPGCGCRRFGCINDAKCNDADTICGKNLEKFFYSAKLDKPWCFADIGYKGSVPSIFMFKNNGIFRPKHSFLMSCPYTNWVFSRDYPEWINEQGFFNFVLDATPKAANKPEVVTTNGISKLVFSQNNERVEMENKFYNGFNDGFDTKPDFHAIYDNFLNNNILYNQGKGY